MGKSSTPQHALGLPGNQSLELGNALPRVATLYGRHFYVEHMMYLFIWLTCIPFCSVHNNIYIRIGAGSSDVTSTNRDFVGRDTSCKR